MVLPLVIWHFRSIVQKVCEYLPIISFNSITRTRKSNLASTYKQPLDELVSQWRDDATAH